MEERVECGALQSELAQLLSEGTAANQNAVHVENDRFNHVSSTRTSYFPSKSVPGVGNTRRLPAAIVLVEPSLCFGDAANTSGEARAVLAGEPARAGRARRELGGIDMAPAGDAVDVFALGTGGPARPLADQLLALTFGETFWGLGHDSP